MALLPVSHQQQQQSDCLTTCVAMTLTYLHIPFKYERLLKVLRTQPFGTVFGNVQDLASIGLTVVVDYGTLEKLAEHIGEGLPCIVAIRTGTPSWTIQTNHAVLVTGIEGDIVYFHDPEKTAGPAGLFSSHSNAC